LPDARLRLLFVCAHPAIDPAMHAPLMLQIVLGLDVGAIAASFLVSPAAMARRLVRAKAKIRETGIRFGVPDPDALASRLEAVLDAIYAAYGHGWNEVTGGEATIDGLADEATFLARLVVARLPGEPEAKGLLALLLHCEARRGARRASDEGFVPLGDQDVTLWSVPLIAEAEQTLEAASRHGRMGRFQLEAAIQSVHAARAHLGFTDWPAIALLYDGLMQLAPTMGVRVGRAAATAEARGPEAGWHLLRDIDPEEGRTYQPYWALKGHLLRRLDRGDEAREAFAQALELTDDEAVRAFLRSR
jgi:RNA polymerase sigma-70 factor (ECF subfamily)